jgi:hypothetical protein
MTHLTEEHVAAYIGKGLTCKLRWSRKKYSLNGIRWGKAVLIGRDGITVYKPLPDVILCVRPLSQLTETIEHNGERFVANQRIGRPNVEMTIDPTLLPYYIVTYLHSLHFDTFGLIDSGLAEPIPSIEQP